jgi:trimeric autotransporter adhesin
MSESISARTEAEVRSLNVSIDGRKAEMMELRRKREARRKAFEESNSALNSNSTGQHPVTQNQPLPQGNASIASGIQKMSYGTGTSNTASIAERHMSPPPVRIRSIRSNGTAASPPVAQHRGDLDADESFGGLDVNASAAEIVAQGGGADDSMRVHGYNHGLGRGSVFSQSPSRISSLATAEPPGHNAMDTSPLRNSVSNSVNASTSASTSKMDITVAHTSKSVSAGTGGSNDHQHQQYQYQLQQQATQIQSLQTQIYSKEQQYIEVFHKLQTASNERDVALTDKNTLNTILEKMQIDEKRYQSSISDYKEQLEQHQNKLNMSRENFREIDEKYNEIAQANIELNRQNSVLATQLTNAGDLQKRIEHSEHLLESKTVEYEKAKQDRKNMSETIYNLRDDIDAQNKELGYFKNQSNVRSSELEKVRLQLHEEMKRSENHEFVENELKEEISNMRLDALEINRKNAYAISSHEAKYQEISSQLNFAENNIKDYKYQIELLNNRLEDNLANAVDSNNSQTEKEELYEKEQELYNLRFALNETQRIADENTEINRMEMFKMKEALEEMRAVVDDVRKKEQQYLVDAELAARANTVNELVEQKEYIQSNSEAAEVEAQLNAQIMTLQQELAEIKLKNNQLHYSNVNLDASKQELQQQLDEQLELVNDSEKAQSDLEIRYKELKDKEDESQEKYNNTITNLHGQIEQLKIQQQAQQNSNNYSPPHTRLDGESKVSGDAFLSDTFLSPEQSERHVPIDEISDGLGLGVNNESGVYSSSKLSVSDNGLTPPTSSRRYSGMSTASSIGSRRESMNSHDPNDTTWVPLAYKQEIELFDMVTTLEAQVVELQANYASATAYSAGLNQQLEQANQEIQHARLQMDSYEKSSYQNNGRQASPSQDGGELSLPFDVNQTPPHHSHSNHSSDKSHNSTTKSSSSSVGGTARDFVTGTMGTLGRLVVPKDNDVLPTSSLEAKKQTGVTPRVPTFASPQSIHDASVMSSAAHDGSTIGVGTGNVYTTYDNHETNSMNMTITQLQQRISELESELEIEKAKYEYPDSASDIQQMMVTQNQDYQNNGITAISVRRQESMDLLSKITSLETQNEDLFAEIEKLNSEISKYKNVLDTDVSESNHVGIGSNYRSGFNPLNNDEANLVAQIDSLLAQPNAVVCLAQKLLGSLPPYMSIFEIYIRAVYSIHNPEKLLEELDTTQEATSPSTQTDITRLLVPGGYSMNDQINQNMVMYSGEEQKMVDKLKEIYKIAPYMSANLVYGSSDSKSQLANKALRMKYEKRLEEARNGISSTNVVTKDGKAVGTGAAVGRVGNLFWTAILQSAVWTLLLVVGYLLITRKTGQVSGVVRVAT